MRGESLYLVAQWFEMRAEIFFFFLNSIKNDFNYDFPAEEIVKGERNTISFICLGTFPFDQLRREGMREGYKSGFFAIRNHEFATSSTRAW